MIFLVMKIDDDDGEGKIYFRIKLYSPNVIFIGGGDILNKDNKI